MNELLEQAIDELKRADHMIFVSLKYTRTVDVIKNILERLISGFDFAFDCLVNHLRETKKIAETPKTRSRRIEILKDYFNDNKEFNEYLDFYYFIRKINKAEFTRRQEFRRHVTMDVVLDDGRMIGLGIDMINDYYDKTKLFIEFVIEFTKEQ